MDQVLQLMVEADNRLEQIPVNGRGAYQMVEARTFLKTAFDALKAMQQEAVDDG